MDEINPLWGYNGNIEIRDYEFRLTCGACPEQYDVFKDGKQVAYIRLRWGQLRVDVPDAGDRTVYFYDFGVECKGVFNNEAERMKYLNSIADELDKLK